MKWKSWFHCFYCRCWMDLVRSGFKTQQVSGPHLSLSQLRLIWSRLTKHMLHEPLTFNIRWLHLWNPPPPLFYTPTLRSLPGLKPDLLNLDLSRLPDLILNDLSSSLSKHTQTWDQHRPDSPTQPSEPRLWVHAFKSKNRKLTREVFESKPDQTPGLQWHQDLWKSSGTGTKIFTDVFEKKTKNWRRRFSTRAPRTWRRELTRDPDTWLQLLC